MLITFGDFWLRPPPKLTEVKEVQFWNISLVSVTLEKLNPSNSIYAMLWQFLNNPFISEGKSLSYQTNVYIELLFIENIILLLLLIQFLKLLL